MDTARSATVEKASTISVIRGGVTRLKERRVSRDLPAKPGHDQPGQNHNDQPYNHLSHLNCRSHRRIISLKTAPWLSSSLAATDSTNPTNLYDSLFNQCVSDNNSTYCSSTEASHGGEGGLHNCDRLFIHITISVAKFHLTTITSPSKHFYTKTTSSSRVKIQFSRQLLLPKSSIIFLFFSFSFFKTILSR